MYIHLSTRTHPKTRVLPMYLMIPEILMDFGMYSNGIPYHTSHSCGWRLEGQGSLVDSIDAHL